MAEAAHNHMMGRISMKPACAQPEHPLTHAQALALHEFMHTVLSAGYKLYATVPPNVADPMIRHKFDELFSKG